MVQREPVNANSVKAMDHQVIERSGEQDFPVRTCKSHIRRAAQRFAFPILGKQSEPAAGQIENPDRIRTVAGNP